MLASLKDRDGGAGAKLFSTLKGATGPLIGLILLFVGEFVTAAYQVDETAPFEPDITRYSFSAVYSRELTETINASIGYTYRTFDQQPDYATGNIVFIEVGKSFSTQF